MKTPIRALFSAIRSLFGRKPEGGAQLVPDRFLVRFKDGIAEDTRCSINAIHGCRQVESIPGINVQVLTVPKGRTLHDMLKIYQRNPHVEFAEPDYIAYAAVIPDDPYFQTYQKSLHKIGAPAAWEITTGSAGVTVAVLDTGVMLTHADLSGRLADGYDFINDTDRPDDDNGHGTGVAGVIGAVTNNGQGIAGITWQNPLMPVKVLNRNGSGNYSVIAKGIIYAADQGARVINLSLGGSQSSATLKQAIDYAQRKKAVVVAAAGNSNGPVLYPAKYPNVIAVAAVDNSDQRASYSNYGPEVSVSAPGNNVWSTTLGGDYRPHTGTSFACPMVAGLAGLILSLKPELSPHQVREIIEKGAVDLGSPGWDKYYGWGRIDLAASLSAIGKTATHPQPDPAPVVRIASPAAGSVVRDVVNIEAVVRKDVTVSGVEFLINEEVAASVNQSPYIYSWDTTALDEGNYRLQAAVYHPDDNRVVSDPVSVNVVQSGPLVFTGRVDRNNNPRATHRFTVSSAGRFEATLSWSLGFADLDLYLYDPKGTLIRSSTDSSFWRQKEVMSLNLIRPGSYTLAVTAASGRANYRLTVIRK